MNIQRTLPYIRKTLLGTAFVAGTLTIASLFKTPGQSLFKETPKNEDAAEWLFGKDEAKRMKRAHEDEMYNFCQRPLLEAKKDYKYDDKKSVVDNISRFTDAVDASIELESNKIGTKVIRAFEDGYEDADSNMQNIRRTLYDNIIDPLTEHPTLPATIAALAMLGVLATKPKENVAEDEQIALNKRLN